MINKPQPQNSLQNKIILITGASDGIGRQAALTYAANGATCILLGRHMKKCEHVYEEICRANFPTPAIYPLDLLTASPADYQTLQSVINDDFGRLDGLLQNAATFATLTPIEHYDIQSWYEVMQVNLNAVFMLSRACIPLLKKSKQAALLFTLSEQAQVAKAYWGAHSCAKQGVQGLMQILAAELANSSVRVNAINPGPVRTKLRAKAYPAEQGDALASPQSIMASYLYLMGDKSVHLNGQCLHAQTEQLSDNGIALA